MYTAYVLSEESRALLAEKFVPQYQEFIGHHVTFQFGEDATEAAPQDPVIKVVGQVDSGDGLQALVVTVDGQYTRPDGSTYHITWSLDPDKYKPVDSNDLVNGYQFTLSLPTVIETKLKAVQPFKKLRS